MLTVSEDERRVKIETNEYGMGTIAARDINTGELILRIKGIVVPAADRYTIQINDETHIFPDEDAGRYLNHSCDPNARIDFSEWMLLAARPIRAGDEVTFNYLTSEWDMAEPFTCGCRADRCYRHISGFRNLDRHAREELKSVISPFLQTEQPV